MEKRNGTGILFYFAIICYPLSAILLPWFFETYFKNSAMASFILNNQFFYLGYLFVTQIISAILIALLILYGRENLRRISVLILLCLIAAFLIVIVFFNYNNVMFTFLNIWYSPKEFMLCLCINIALIIASVISHSKHKKQSKRLAAADNSGNSIPSTPQNAAPDAVQGMPNAMPYDNTQDNTMNSLYR